MKGVADFYIQNRVLQCLKHEMGVPGICVNGRSRSRCTMARTRTLVTVHGTATRAASLYDLLRSDLLDGTLSPGSKLAIVALSEHDASSQTPDAAARSALSPGPGLHCGVDRYGPVGAWFAPFHHDQPSRQRSPRGWCLTGRPNPCVDRNAGNIDQISVII